MLRCPTQQFPGSLICYCILQQFSLNCQIEHYFEQPSNNFEKSEHEKKSNKGYFEEYLEYHDEIVALNKSGQQVNSKDILKTLQAMNWHGLY